MMKTLHLLGPVTPLSGPFFLPSQRFAVTLDHPAMWGIDASLEELRKKIRDAVKYAVPKWKVT